MTICRAMVPCRAVNRALIESVSAADQLQTVPVIEPMISDGGVAYFQPCQRRPSCRLPEIVG